MTFAVGGVALSHRRRRRQQEDMTDDDFRPMSMPACNPILTVISYSGSVLSYEVSA